MSYRSAEWCRGRATAAVALLVVIAALGMASVARADDHDGRVLFTQQDAVQAFDPSTGLGFQTGTTTGEIRGTSSVNFQFTFTGGPKGDAFPIAFHNTVVITDLDGDQIFFVNDGTGTFHVGGADFRGTGGPLSGTYVVTGGTGKFHGWKVGATFDYRAVATNPPSATPAFGNVYVEIFSHDKDKDGHK